MTIRKNFGLRPIGKNILVCERQEYDFSAEKFEATSGPDKGKKFTLVQSGMEAYAPGRVDNMGTCEVISVGSDVVDIKPGDLGIIDWSEVSKSCPIGNETHHFIPESAFQCWIDKEGELHPRGDMIITKYATDRMRNAMYGTSAFELPPAVATGGFPCKWGATHKLIQKAERILNLPANYRMSLRLPRNPPEYWPMFRMLYNEVTHVGTEISDIQKGELLALITELATIFTVHGTKYHMVSRKQGAQFVVDDE